MPQQNSEISYVPNMGIRDFMIAPIDLSFLYRDTDETPLPISIFIKHIDECYTITPTAPTSRHWCIIWQVQRTLGKPETDTKAFRALHIVRERDRSGTPCKHLTNWGPMTKVYTLDVIQKSKFIRLGTLGLEGRKKLEEIARNTKVRVPDGQWTIQDWVMEVLTMAVREMIFGPDLDLEAVRRLALQPSS